MLSHKDQKVTSIEPLETKDAKWVKLVKINYTDPNGIHRTWESSERRTRPKGVELDGVGILAILENPDDPNYIPRVLLQKQFRPPVNKMCIEVPAGLLDAGETPEECAIRELYEETGYTGKIVPLENGAERSSLMFNDPGFCNTNLYMIHLKVDLSDPKNQNPKQHLEENEFIECFSVPLKDLYKECKRLEEEGYAIDARVGTFAEGLEVGRRWRL